MGEEQALKLRDWQLETHKAIRDHKAPPAVLFESGAENLSIYQNGYWLRTLGSLKEDFPLLARLLGKNAFEQKVRGFLSPAHDYHCELGALSLAFFAFLGKCEKQNTILRAARLDILESRARRAAEPVGGGSFFGLHPSAALLESEGRYYVIWRNEGSVRRERIRERDFSLLQCFESKGELSVISGRLERKSFSPAFVQESVAMWTNLGLISSLPREDGR